MILFFSQILRKDEAPLDRSALPDDERRDFDDFLNQMKEVNKKPSILATAEHQNNGQNSAPIRNKSIVVSNSLDSKRMYIHISYFESRNRLLQRKQHL